MTVEDKVRKFINEMKKHYNEEAAKISSKIANDLNWDFMASMDSKDAQLFQLSQRMCLDLRDLIEIYDCSAPTTKEEIEK